MSTEPYASARRGVWVVHNGSSHRGEAATNRLRREWATLRLVHLPVHASWLNQIEIVFSVVQRKVLTPNDVADLEDLAERLRRFEARFNLTAQWYCPGRPATFAKPPRGRGSGAAAY